MKAAQLRLCLVGFIFPLVGIFLLGIFLLGCASSEPAPHAARAWERPETSSSVGVHMLLTDGGNDWPETLWRSHLQEAQAAVGPWGYVIVLLRIDDLDQRRWQFFMDLCTELELTPILRLATSHNPSGGWSAPLADADGAYKHVASSFSDLIASLKWPPTLHTGGKFVIVGNEPNRGDEWGGRPNPAEYARFLVNVATALHGADSDIRILNAGFDLYAPHTGDLPLEAGFFMDAESFMDEMVAASADVFTHVDVWSSHSYPLGPFSAEPSYQLYQRDMVHGAENPNHAQPPEGIYNRGISAYQWELWKLASYGIEELPVLITETGWRHSESIIASSGDELANLPTVSEVATYMSESLDTWQEDEQVKGAVFFAFDGHPEYWGHTNWLHIGEQGDVLGRYEELFGAMLQVGADE